MRTTFDTNAILYKLFKNNAIGNDGGCYAEDDRPTDSQKEDVTFNTIKLSQEYYPQYGRSNVNIYVADSYVNIKGVKQRKTNVTRLKTLANKAMEILREARIQGLKIIVEEQDVLSYPSLKQHCANIRLFWNIQSD